VKISTVLDNIDLGAMALPEFQRGYVWNRSQVRGLMGSLYRRHPAGSLLVWVTKSEAALARGDGQLQPGFVSLLLDGQQRISSLYGIVRGQPPQFFDGNEAFRPQCPPRRTGPGEVGDFGGIADAHSRVRGNQEERAPSPVFASCWLRPR
jgi:hypothetical protein